MADKSRKAGGLEVVLAHLRHPLKLRLAVSLSMLAVWYFGFYSSMIERMTAVSARIGIDHKRITTSREVEKLRKMLAISQKNFKPTTDPNQLIQHLMDHLRSSPLKLVDLKPEKSKGLGGYEALGFGMNLQGSFVDVASFLEWVENDASLLRVDELILMPEQADRSKLKIKLRVLGLVEKASAAVKAG
jgi:hypothetical protein